MLHHLLFVLVCVCVYVCVCMCVCVCVFYSLWLFVLLVKAAVCDIIQFSVSQLPPTVHHNQSSIFLADFTLCGYMRCWYNQLHVTSFSFLFLNCHQIYCTPKSILHFWGKFFLVCITSSDNGCFLKVFLFVLEDSDL